MWFPRRKFWYTTSTIPNDNRVQAFPGVYGTQIVSATYCGESFRLGEFSPISKFTLTRKVPYSFSHRCSLLAVTWFLPPYMCRRLSPRKCCCEAACEAACVGCLGALRCQFWFASHCVRCCESVPTRKNVRVPHLREKMPWEFQKKEMYKELYCFPEGLHERPNAVSLLFKKQR